MFCSRTNNEISDDLFIEKPKRIMAILQLCLVFSVILWVGGSPFLGEHYQLKSKLSLYHFLMGNENEGKEGNREKFQALSIEEQQEVLNGYNELLREGRKTFWEKMWLSFWHLFIGTPLFALLWIAFSLLIPILALLKVEGAYEISWILPLLVGCYAVDNFIQGTYPTKTYEEKLYPSEAYIVEKYVKVPLSGNISTQMRLLRRAWGEYLIYEWAKEIPAQEESLFSKQQAKGEFAFQLARLKAKQIDAKKTRNEKTSPYLLSIYLSWNILFAYILSRKK